MRKSAWELKTEKQLKEFKEKHGNGHGGFESTELASEYARLKLAWWGSNLVFVGIEEREGRYYPQFNVWD